MHFWTLIKLFTFHQICYYSNTYIFCNIYISIENCFEFINLNIIYIYILYKTSSENSRLRYSIPHISPLFVVYFAAYIYLNRLQLMYSSCSLDYFSPFIWVYSYFLTNTVYRVYVCSVCATNFRYFSFFRVFSTFLSTPGSSFLIWSNRLISSIIV